MNEELADIYLGIPRPQGVFWWGQGRCYTFIQTPSEVAAIGGVFKGPRPVPSQEVKLDASRVKDDEIATKADNQHQPTKALM